MPTRLIFQEDSYAKTFEALVLRVEGSFVVLDRTAFHPAYHGGLDTDTGYLEGPRGKARVIRAELRGDDVYHIVEDPSTLSSGDRVRGEIDWDRRYTMMRMHTAAHVLIAQMYKNYGALVTGGHIAPDQARMDFDIRQEDWKAVIEEGVAEANEVISRCIEVKVYWLPREEALKIPGITKLAEMDFLLGLESVRVVEIPGVDLQADGGPHVRNTCEIGEIRVLRLESKGRTRKRIYYVVG